MKNLLGKVWNWIEGIWSKAEKKVEGLIPVATNIVQGVKKAVESDHVEMALEIAKTLIPGKADDVIIDKGLKIAREYVPKVAVQLKIVNSITKIEDTNQQMIAVMQVLRGTGKEEKSKYWHELSKQILYALSDGEITWGEAGALVEYYYKNNIKK